MKPSVNDTEPFEAKLSTLPKHTPNHMRDALVIVNDNVDFAKRILLQHRVRDFSAADVVAVAKMITDLQMRTVSASGELDE